MTRRDLGLTRNDIVDLGLAALALALSFSVLIGMNERSAIEMPIAWWLAALHSLPVVIRRRHPVPAFAVSALAGFVYLVLGLPMVGLGLTMLLIIYTLGVEVSRSRSLTGLVGVEVGLVVALLVAETGTQVDTMIGNALTLAAVWLIGDSARRRREHVLAERVAAAERAAVDERLRIARELHDIVAHTMTVISVQAGMARLVVDDDPVRAKRSLEVIEGASRDAMDEMRRLLQVLRSDGATSSSLVPTPGLADLPALVSQAIAGGTPVDVCVSGEPRLLPPGVELAAYRVVQEGLTNVRKHATGSPATVEVEFSDGGLRVSVVSELEGGAAVGAPGLGLSGMRERVELYRGEVAAGANGDGTYRVSATFPSTEVSP